MSAKILNRIGWFVDLQRHWNYDFRQDMWCNSCFPKGNRRLWRWCCLSDSRWGVVSGLTTWKWWSDARKRDSRRRLFRIQLFWLCDFLFFFLFSLRFCSKLLIDLFYFLILNLVWMLYLVNRSFEYYGEGYGLYKCGESICVKFLFLYFSGKKTRMRRRK